MSQLNQSETYEKADNTDLAMSLDECLMVMHKHITPIPDRGPDHPWEIFKRARRTWERITGKSWNPDAEREFKDNNPPERFPWED